MAKELEIKDDEWDLRDPCFCIEPKTGTLNLYYGRYSYFNQTPCEKKGVYSLTILDGKLHIEDDTLLNIGDYSSYWLWKVYFIENKFYGVAYMGEELPILLTSEDGHNFQIISQLPVQGNETSIEVIDDTLYCFIRNIEASSNSYIAKSAKPYTHWTYKTLSESIESPESFSYKGEIYVTGRSRYGMSTYRYDKTTDEVVPFYNYFALGGYGDIGYPGIIVDKDKVYVVYYAMSYDMTHTCIYETVLSNF